MFAAETFGVMPDVLCTAKGLSGGYAPLSAMICREPIADAFWGPIETNPGFVEGHTFEGNPISCAAGHRRAARDPRARPAARNARAQGERLRAGFERLADEVRRHRRHPRQGAVPGRSSSSSDPTTKERFPAEIGFGVQVGRRALAERPALPLRPALDRLRPAAGRRRPSRSTRWWRSWRRACATSSIHSSTGSGPLMSQAPRDLAPATAPSPLWRRPDARPLPRGRAGRACWRSSRISIARFLGHRAQLAQATRAG